MLYATQFVEYKGMDDFTKVKIWERGIMQQVNAFNVMKDIGIPEEDILTGEQAFENIRQVLDDTSSFSTRTSNKRIAKTLFKDFVDISKPVTMLTAKEIPYTTIPRGEAEFEKISTNSRARQIMQRNVRKFKKFIPQTILTEFERQRTINSGLWVERSDLARLSGTQFVKPSLHFNVSFFMRPDRENRDDRVHRSIPLIPTVPPEDLNRYRNFVLNKSYEFQGRDEDSKYKRSREGKPIHNLIDDGLVTQPKGKIPLYQLRPEFIQRLQENLLLEEGASDESVSRFVHRIMEQTKGSVMRLLQQAENRKYDKDDHTENFHVEQEFLQPIGVSDEVIELVDGENSESVHLSFSTSLSSVDRLPDDASEDTDLTQPSTDEEW